MRRKVLLFAPETFNLAETTRMIEVAKQCRHKAHCLFMGYSTKFSALIEEEGFTFQLLEPTLSEVDIAAIMAFDQMKSLKNPFTYKLLKQRIESELALIDEVKPDGIIIGSTVSLFISARVRAIPLVYVKPFAYSRGHIESPEFMKQSNQLVRRIVQGISLQLKWLPRSFKRAIRDYSIQEKFNYTLDFFDGDLNCITTPEVFTNTKYLPKNYTYTGPIFAKLARSIPQEIITLAKEKTDPLIYFSMGSSANQAIVYQLLLHLAALKVQVISPMKSYLTKEQQQSLPETIHLYDWLPAEEIHYLVDYCVLHGGEGTVQTACMTGKPFIGIGLQAEQSYNISCCVSYGNAIQIKKKRIGTGVFFQQQLHELIENPSYQERAVQLQKELSGEEGAKRAAETIFDYLQVDQV